MLFRRAILSDLESHVSTPDIVVVTGMRRSGKTTLLRMIFDKLESDNKVFIDLENPIDRMAFEEKDYNNIWANLRAHGLASDRRACFFLDEIQAAPAVVSAVKYLHDHYDAKFFLTGSSSFYLKNLFPESLAGRKIVFELRPLDFREFLVFKQVEKEFFEDFSRKDAEKNAVVFEKTVKLFEEYLEFGGFPQVVLTPDHGRKKAQLGDIFKSYFEKDVEGLADFRRIERFRDLMLLLLQRTGSKVDVSKLASEVGVSRPTAQSYIAFLRGTYFIDLLPPHARNRDREVSGARKVYLCDTGFVRHFGRVDEGRLFENAVFLNLRKYGEVRYYQKRSGREIDFVLPGKGIGVEVKNTGSERDYRALVAAGRSIGLKEHFVVTRRFRPDRGFVPALEL
jgi:predicted AAA+ superfamily ATPase